MSTTNIDSKAQWYGQILLRVSLGGILWSHGILKTLSFPGTLEFFASLGLPPVIAYIVIALEIVGGALLIVGVETRWAALIVLPGLLGAVWAHSGNGWLFSSIGGGWEYPALLALLAVVQVLVGNGSFPIPAKLKLSWHSQETAA